MAAKVTKAAPKKPAPGRRGRQKQYSDPRAQAAAERMKEIRAKYTALTNVLKPALEDQADRSLQQLRDDPKSFEESPEFEAIVEKLAARYTATVNRIDYTKKLQDEQNLELRTRKDAVVSQSYLVSVLIFLTCLP